MQTDYCVSVILINGEDRDRRYTLNAEDGGRPQLFECGTYHGGVRCAPYFIDTLVQIRYATSGKIESSFPLA